MVPLADGGLVCVTAGVCHLPGCIKPKSMANCSRVFAPTNHAIAARAGAPEGDLGNGAW